MMREPARHPADFKASTGAGRKVNKRERETALVCTRASVNLPAFQPFLSSTFRAGHV